MYEDLARIIAIPQLATVSGALERELLTWHFRVAPGTAFTAYHLRRSHCRPSRRHTDRRASGALGARASSCRDALTTRTGRNDANSPPSERTATGKLLTAAHVDRLGTAYGTAT